MTRSSPSPALPRLADYRRVVVKVGSSLLVDAAGLRRSWLEALAADIVAAHVANNSVPASEVPTLITTIYGALAGLGTATVAPDEPAKPSGASQAIFRYTCFPSQTLT